MDWRQSGLIFCIKHTDMKLRLEYTHTHTHTSASYRSYWVFSGSPVVVEAGHVIAVKDVLPAVDVNDASGHCDEQHQGKLNHVTDLNQHCGGHQCQHSNVAVIFGIVQAAFKAGHGGQRGGGSHCGGV